MDNFVKNFFLALVLEYSGMALGTEIHTLKIKMRIEINGLLESFGKCFKKCIQISKLAVLVEYSAASRMVLRIERLSNPQFGSCPCLNLSI